MNTDWEVAIEFVLKIEGGEEGELVPNDRGGYTKFGISSVANPDVDVPNLTKEGAKQIYRERYWNTCRCDELPSPLAICVFDSAVNQGVTQTKKMLQIALGGVKVDGIIGEETITAIFKSDEKLTRRFMAQRMARYARIIMRDQSQEVFIENWSDRLMRVAQIVFKQLPAVA